MTRPGTVAVDLAQQIVEDGFARHVADAVLPLEQSFVRLHEVVRALVGRAGFEALMRRAVHLSKPSAPWLATIHFVYQPTFAVHGLGVAVEREGAAQVRAGATTLLEHMLAILCHFIGDDLTVRLAERVWTQADAEPADPEGPEPGGGQGT